MLRTMKIMSIDIDDVINSAFLGVGIEEIAKQAVPQISV